MSAVKSGILDVFACDSSAYDVFAPTHSPIPPGVGTGVWLPAYATLSHNMLEFRHDPRLFKEQADSPDSPPKHDAEAPRNVLVSLQAQEPLGLHISGGSDFGLPVFISKLSENSVAERCAELNIGDEIQSVNGVHLTGGETHSHVANLLQAAVAARRVDLVVQYSREMVQQCEIIVDEQDGQAARDAGAAAAGAACRSICVPLNGMSVWRQAALVFGREMCALIDEPDRRSRRCFGLSSLSDPACLFRARSATQADQWCAAIAENVRGGLRETLFAANAALHGHVTVSNLQHLAWMRVRTLTADGTAAAGSHPPGGDVKLVAISDSAVAIYGSRSPPATSDGGMTSPERSDDDHQLAAEEHIAFWSCPEVILPIVHSRLVEPSASGGSGSLPSLTSAEGCVILRTGVASGLERRIISSEHTVDLVLWKMEFRKAWQTVPSVVGRMQFPVIWHGEQCKAVLDPRHDSVAVFVGDCKEKMLTILFSTIKRTSDDGRQRFQIWLDSQSCVSFKFEHSFKLFQTAFISFLAYHKSNLSSV